MRVPGALLVFGMLGLGALGLGGGDRVSRGAWGGQGIALEVTESGARLEFDCAHGRIDEPMRLDANGQFGIRGLFFRERGGPVREGEESKGEPARYSGRVDGETMVLTVRLADRDVDIGTFTLVHGKPARLRKCL